jgi:hypothetical protein
MMRIEEHFADVTDPRRREGIYQPVENRRRGVFQPRQVRSKAPHGSQNNDLRRHFGITSM